MKPKRVTMTDADGKKYFWKFARFERAWNCGGNLKKGRPISGWSFTDHDGIERSVEGNWGDLVAAFKLTAENYGFTCNIS